VNAAEAEDKLRAGVAAMQRRDAATARALFGEVIASGAVAPPWILLAQACRLADDDEAEAAALDSLLAGQPRDVRALIMRGDCHARAGDSRAAGSYYKAALQSASTMADLAPSLAGEVRRAEAEVERAEAQFRDGLERHLVQAGFDASRRSPRFQESLDILGGAKQAYFQEPSSYFFPGLPQIQFYERAQFPWLAAIEAAVPEMRAELLLVVEEEGAFVPYIEDDPDRPQTGHSLRGDPRWSAFHLLKNGRPVEDNAARCPRTVEALKGAPLPHIEGRSPMALFSLLRPGAHIPAHNGLLNTRLICHIPLVVPPGCRLRVGNETRIWEEGKALIFDDSVEHEAWNESGETRVILLFEIWRPEIDQDERRALTAMFEAITQFRGDAEPSEG
jgi:aspartyl/asparaginyl beta-hydroxylase (cupin superfamily)